jgi:hypothetical protein
MPKVNGLTVKQLNFCKNVVSGMSNFEAYKNAYDCGNMKESTIYTESSKLACKQSIQEQIKAMQAPQIKSIQIQNINAKQKQIKFIEERINLCKSNGDESSVIKYTEMLNKIYGLYKDTDENETKQSSIDKLDTTDLIKLIG